MSDLSPRLPVLLAGLALALAGCGSGSASHDAAAAHSATPTVTTPTGTTSTPHNGADLAFLREMTPHHRGAVVMAELAETRAADPRVKDLARRIRDAQQPEIDRMQQLAAGWGEQLDSGPASGHGASAPPASGGHGGAGGHSADDEDAAALQPLRGPAFDREFLRRMTEHHRGAVTMARTVLDRGSDPEVERLAGEIIRVQQSEIEEMARLRPGS